MSRYIDAEAFIDDLYEHEFSNWCDKDEVSTLVNDAPSIDIVRCAECKWRGEQTESGIPYYWCRLVGVGYEVPIEHYCSYGERKESE